MMATPTSPAWAAGIEPLDGCEDLSAWYCAMPQSTTSAEAWERCDRGDWMLRVLALTTFATSQPWSDERRPLAACANDCAKLALPIFEARAPYDARARYCIDVLDRWVRGEATPEEVVLVRDDGRSAAAVYNSGANAAVNAVTDAIDTAAYAVTHAVAHAAVSAIANTAYANAAAATHILNARDRVLRECADIVRRHFPAPPPALLAALGLPFEEARQATERALAAQRQS